MRIHKGTPTEYQKEKILKMIFLQPPNVTSKKFHTHFTNTHTHTHYTHTHARTRTQSTHFEALTY